MAKQGINFLGTRGYDTAYWSVAAHRADPLFTDYMVSRPEFTKSPTYTSWPEHLGDEWNTSLSRINHTYSVIAALGLNYVRDWIQPYKWWGWLQQFTNNPDIPITVTENDGWEPLDLSVQLAQLYGIKIVLCFREKGLTGYGTRAENWILPQVEFVIDRYKEYADTIIIDPVNEINSGNITGGATEWVKYQVGVYDAVKAIAPTMQVDLASCYNVSNTNHVKSFIDAMASAGKLAKFDSVCMHMYPTFSGSILDYTGNDGLTGITQCISALNGYGRSDAQVNVDEFGIFWEGTGARTESESATNVTEVFASCESNSRVDRSLYWRLWGSDRDTEPLLFVLGSGHITEFFAQRGTGILDEHDRGANTYLAYDAIADLGLTPKEFSGELFDSALFGNNNLFDTGITSESLATTATVTTTITDTLGSTTDALFDPELFGDNNLFDTGLAGGVIYTESLADTWTATTDISDTWLAGSTIYTESLADTWTATTDISDSQNYLATAIEGDMYPIIVGDTPSVATYLQGEERLRYVAFRRTDGLAGLETNETISAATVTAYSSAGVDSSTDMIDTVSHDDTEVSYLLMCPDPGTYLVITEVTSSYGQTLLHRLALTVQEVP